MGPKAQPQKKLRDWLKIIEDTMIQVYGHAFEISGKAFSYWPLRDRFVKDLLVNSGVLTVVRLDDFEGKDGPDDPLRGMDREAIYDAARASAARETSRRIKVGIVYYVDPTAFDEISIWDERTRRDGGKLTSDFRIRRGADKSPQRRLLVSNPSGQRPDYPWDRPHQDNPDE